MKISNPPGLVFRFSDSGAVQDIEVDPIRINLRTPALFSRAGANLYLRKLGSPCTYVALLGPESPSRFCVANGVFEARGSWAGLDYQCVLELANSELVHDLAVPGLAWRWHVRVCSQLDRPTLVDLIYVQDVGLKAKAPGLLNELYVGQYVERRVFEDPQHGSVVCCRQNMRESVGHPWLMIACTGRAVAASTDGQQFYGPTFRATAVPEALRGDLLGGELSGESSVVAIQHQPFELSAGQSYASAFVASYVPDHPLASSDDDLRRLAELMRAFSQPSERSASAAFSAPAQHRFQKAELLRCDDLSQDELVELFGSTRRHTEEADGQLLSFFTDGPRHVVLRAKEARVTRPHGHIMQAKIGLTPDESIMSTTAFACGIFNSHLTQGNTNFDTLLSVCPQPATPALEGQRIFVQLDDAEYLLGVPSAFEMGPNCCRWIYKRGSLRLQVRTWTSPGEPRVNLDIQVERPGPVGLSLTHQFDESSGWTVRAGAEREHIARPSDSSAIAKHFPSAQFRMLVNSVDGTYSASGADVPEAEPSATSLFVIDVAETTGLCMSFVGEVVSPAHVTAITDAETQWRKDCQSACSAWHELSRGLSLSGPGEVSAIREILPWYALNALVHYLTPYGLEQFSGAAWGTRDVCQGPLDLLLCQEQYAAAKQVLRVVFSHQNPDGGWPQWWMFDHYRSVRADSAHGDVIYWCILALCAYITASGDFAFLDEPLPYFSEAGGTGATAATPVREHVDRIIRMIAASFVPGTALVQFGGGDWNDSLQPVSRDLARRLISSWTVQMSYQAMSEYRELCQHVGNTRAASELDEMCQQILSDFHRYLVRDDVVAGYGLVAEQPSTSPTGTAPNIDVLLHPRDSTTGVHYSLLPMNRGIISGIFSRAQAERHLQLIEQHLKGPDGARLMDRPLPYRGGPQTLFQRAESSSYFGREIGLMYVHEHLRYAETLSRMGKPDAFLHALRQAIPVEYQQVVPQGGLRQANCYYSSSDVVFRSRYEADARYDDVIAGRIPLEGGWRIYSSGPGIYVSLVVSRLLGLRVELGKLVIDPVMPRCFDGLQAVLRFRGHPVRFLYRVIGQGFSPRAVTVGGEALALEREQNGYRDGGAVVLLEEFMARIKADGDARDATCVEVEI